MSTSANNEWSKGKLVGVARSLPPVTVDCSNWESDIPDDHWCAGKLVGVAQSVPAVSLDCSHWERNPLHRLELIISFETTTPPGRVMEHANRLIAAAAQAAPELGLTYDFTHSRTENDDVVIALAPRNATAAARLDAAAEIIRRAMNAVHQGVQVRVAGTAA